MNARGRALRIAVLLAVAASAQAAVPRHFGRLTVARMGGRAGQLHLCRATQCRHAGSSDDDCHAWVGARGGVHCRRQPQRRASQRQLAHAGQ